MLQIAGKAIQLMLYIYEFTENNFFFSKKLVIREKFSEFFVHKEAKKSKYKVFATINIEIRPHWIRQKQIIENE